MEEQLQQQKKTKMKKKRRILKKKKYTNKTLFPLLFAALLSKSCCSSKPIIKKCLKKLSLSLKPDLNLSPFLSLLPALLNSKCTDIVCRSLEIIGAASLASFEMNEKIALEDDIVKGLISLLGSSRREIAMDACNAVLDLSTTAVGRHHLIELSAIENSMHLNFSAATLSLPADTILLKDDEYPLLLLQSAIALINSCTINQLRSIPVELREIFLKHLQRMWGQAHRQRLCSTSRCKQDSDYYRSHVRSESLAESIFRLSIDHDLHQGPTGSNLVKKSIFDLVGVSIERFLAETWEISSMFIRNSSVSSIWQESIFGPFIEYLGSRDAIPTFLPSMLTGIVSCPEIASDELDILHIIKEIKNNLGCPIMCHQDIRVVKTQCNEKESHYFQDQVLDIYDIFKCEEAFKEGYSIALRGMELRFPTIAAIADRLASTFGQPSAGVNMYLTPSNSQGLARHSDDHCVLVCQLIGTKIWTLYPRSGVQLPRLYESCDSLHDLEDERRITDERQRFLLKEGDVLYIPRGIPHEAWTGINDDERTNNISGFSLHLTLAIEIEPPFEWEGFMQAALYCWNKKQDVLLYSSSDSTSRSLHLASVRLLHIAIKLISSLDPTFRKACLVGAELFSANTKHWLVDNQRTIFGHLISKISSESKYSNATQHLKMSLEKNEDPLEHLSWMKHLSVEGEAEGSADNRYVFDLLVQHREIAETAFMQVKSNFSDEVEFQDVEPHYKVLLDKYRKVRKQYTNGMLSLHCSIGDEHRRTTL